MDNVIKDINGKEKRVRVYDAGERFVDRYTVVLVSDADKDSSGDLYYPMFGCNESPSNPQGFGMFVGDYYPSRHRTYNLGKRIWDIGSLPAAVVGYIRYVAR